MTYRQEIERAGSVEELDEIVRRHEALEAERETRRVTAPYRATIGDDIGSVLSLLAFGIDEVKRASSEGYDSELEFHIDF